MHLMQPAVKPIWQPVECLYTRYNWLDNRLYRVYKQPVWQPVGCLFTRCSRFSKQLYNQFDNQLYRVNGVLRQTCIRRSFSHISGFETDAFPEYLHVWPVQIHSILKAFTSSTYLGLLEFRDKISWIPRSHFKNSAYRFSQICNNLEIYF